MASPSACVALQPFSYSGIHLPTKQRRSLLSSVLPTANGFEFFQIPHHIFVFSRASIDKLCSGAIIQICKKLFNIFCSVVRLSNQTVRILCANELSSGCCIRVIVNSFNCVNFWSIIKIIFCRRELVCLLSFAPYPY